MKEAYPNARKLDLPGEGPGTFDQVWHNPDGQPEFIIVECKGGSATNSSSRRVDDVRVQQGRMDYAADILRNILNNPDLADSTLDQLATLQYALENGSTLYLEITQKLSQDELSDLIVRHYL